LFWKFAIKLFEKILPACQKFIFAKKLQNEWEMFIQTNLNK